MERSTTTAQTSYARRSGDSGRAGACWSPHFLNNAAFANPGPNYAGSLGRNSFAGPGSVALDVSLSREFALAPLGDAGRLTIRADAYNALNHANLANPDAYLNSAEFDLDPMLFT